MGRREELCLIRGLAALGRPERCRVRGEDHAPDVCLQALPKHHARAAHVDLEQPGAVGWAHRGHAGGVEYEPHALQRPPDRPAVEHVAPDLLHIEIVNGAGVRALADGHAKVVATLDEPPRDVTPDEAGCGR